MSLLGGGANANPSHRPKIIWLIHWSPDRVFIIGGVVGEPSDVAAIDVHQIDFAVAISCGVEGDLAAIG